MNDCMTFPDTVEEFMEQYKVVDTEHIYTNGSEFVPIFRMKQWFEHLPSEQSKPEAISEWKKEFREYVGSLDIARDDWKGIIEYIDELPSAQPNTTTYDSIPAKTGENDGDRTSGDCISRQQAIGAFETAAKSGASIEDIKLILAEMPLVQPSIIRCKDCKYYKYGICMKIGANKSFYGFCDWAERGEQDE